MPPKNLPLWGDSYSGYKQRPPVGSFLSDMARGSTLNAGGNVSITASGAGADSNKAV